jgi:hypothetical protein
MNIRRLLWSLPAYLLALTASSKAQGQGDHPAQHPAQAGAMTGSVAGVVTALGPKGDTIRVANALIQLWKTDPATSAARDAACSAWSADTMTWTQAKEELESPSGMNLAGTPVGHDVDVLRTLMSLRGDTARSDANGAFTLNDVAFGAYTVDAEVYANKKFMQWSKDVGVIPKIRTRTELDGTSLAENQYCMAPAAADTGLIYNSDALDYPLKHDQPNIDMRAFPSLRNSIGTTRIAFVLSEKGIPEPKTVRVVEGTVTPVDARMFVANFRYSVPTVHGVPVRVNAELGLGTATAEVHRP